MIQFIIRRLLVALPALFGIIFIVFMMARMLPGDPCRAALGERATDEICTAFAARYGLIQVPVEDGGHDPGPRHLAEVIDRAKADGSKSIVVQPQFSRKSAQTVADAIEGEVVVLDPLAADYPDNLLRITDTLVDRFANEDGAKQGNGS